MGAVLIGLLRRVFSRRHMLEAGLIIALVSAVQLYQSSGLPDGAAPPLEGVRNDGSQGSLLKVGAGDTANQPNQPTLVVFWADWCPVCKAEEGNIESIAKDHRVLSVAMQSGDAAAVTKHLKERGLTQPALVDSDGRHAANWKVRGVPTHFIIDGAGNVRFRVVGYATTLGLRARLWWAATFPA